MKVVLVVVFVMFAAATALAYGGLTVSTNMSAVAAEVVEATGEPAAMLLSGSFLLGLAGVVKRFTI